MEPTMSRRQFLKLAAGTMAGTATAELAGLGFPTVYARPPAQRIKFSEIRGMFLVRSNCFSSPAWDD